MKLEDRFLFLAARQKLQPEHIQSMQAIAARPGFNWQRMFLIAAYHGIAPLVYKHVSCIPELAGEVPQPLKDHYKLYSARNALVKKERLRLLHQTLEFFYQRDIQVIVFKGTAQELLVYDEPWITESFDIDIILNRREETFSFDETQEIQAQLYRKRVEFDFFEHHDMNMNRLLPINFENVWQKARPFTLDGVQCLLLSPEDHLISLCVNSCRKRFFRLKSLFDIHEAIERCPELNWDAFFERARAFGCEKVVYTALLVYSRTLNSGYLPESMSKQLGINRFRAAILNSTVAFLMRFWSLPGGRSKPLFDFSLSLPYASYTMPQAFQKIQQVMKRHK